MIELQGIGRTYRRPTGESVVALNDVSLRIERGEFVAIVGASGSGKSTLMNIVGLLDRPDAGRYLLDGRDVSGLDVNAQARVRNKKIGFVFQMFHLLPRTTALQNVELPLLYSDRTDLKGLGRRALEAVGLGEAAVIRVCDDGPGIPASLRANVFEPFFRADRSRSRKTGGYGLGLSICKRIMEAHGGAVAIEDHAGRGASFVLTLPLA